MNETSEKDTNITSSAHDLPDHDCPTNCNYKLLNQIYELLQNIVENKKTKTEEKKTDDVDAKQLFKSAIGKAKKLERKASGKKTKYLLKPKDKLQKVQTCPTDIDDKNPTVFNVYNNNEGSNHLMLCNCNKPRKEKSCSNFPSLKDNSTTVTQSCTRSDNIYYSSAQCWQSIGEIKKQELVDCACQYSYILEEAPQDKKSIQNLLNDPKFRECMKLIPAPNIIVLTNGCTCSSKNKTTIDKTSVTTNTSEVFKEQKNNVPELNVEMGDILPAKRESKKVLVKDEPNTDQSGGTTTKQQNDLSCLTPYTELNTLVPPETDVIVASALVSKKKKKSGKGKKRKGGKGGGAGPDNTVPIVSCCQTESGTENKVRPPSSAGKNTDNYCEMLKKHTCSYRLRDAFTQNPEENPNDCKCSDMQSFFTSMLEMFTKMQQKSEELKGCECSSKDDSCNTMVCEKVEPKKRTCEDIQCLAEKIVEIYMKANKNKNPQGCSKNNSSINSNSLNGNSFNSHSLNDNPSPSNCASPNCIRRKPIPKQESDHDEDCCKKCSCTKCKSSRHNRRDDTHQKKKEKCKCTTSHSPKRGPKKSSHEYVEYEIANRWLQEPPPPCSPPPPPCPERKFKEKPQCGCSHLDCELERECESIHCDSLEDCGMETCPHLYRIAKECLCDTKNCYCHNKRLQELKTSANLERLADEVVNAILPCSCKNCSRNPENDPEMGHYSTRQVCLTSINHEKQRKFFNNTDKGKKLFDKDFHGNPCLNGSKSQTDLYIQNLINTKAKYNLYKNNPAVRKLIKSGKKLKPLIISPAVPIAEAVCPHKSYINSLYPDIYQALSKMKQLTNCEVLPQEIIEIVIDKILKREIKCALQQMREGVVKVNTDQKNTNILNILLEDKNCVQENNTKQFNNNNMTDNCLEPKTEKEGNSEEIIHDSKKLEDSDTNNKHSNMETINVNEEDKTNNKKPILVQINIEKGKSSIKEKKVSFEKSTESFTENASSVYITENKFGSIKQLITARDDKSEILEENKQPISININIGMDKEKKLSNRYSEMSTLTESAEAIKPRYSSCTSNCRQSLTESTEEVEPTYSSCTSDYRQYQTESTEEIKPRHSSCTSDYRHSSTESTEKISVKQSLSFVNSKTETSNEHLYEQNISYYPRYHIERTNSPRMSDKNLPLLDDFLAMNNTMRVTRLKCYQEN